MAGKPVCLVCQKEMVKGFITDLGHADAIFVPRWCEGTPQPPQGMHPGLRANDGNRSQFEKGSKVVAYRCPECEALRLYAPSNPQ